MSSFIKLNADDMRMQGIVTEHYSWLSLDQWIDWPNHLVMEVDIYFKDIASVEKMLVALQTIADGMAAKTPVDMKEQ